MREGGTREGGMREGGGRGQQHPAGTHAACMRWPGTGPAVAENMARDSHTHRALQPGLCKCRLVQAASTLEPYVLCKIKTFKKEQKKGTHLAGCTLYRKSI